MANLYLNFWTKAFNINEKAGRKEFWIALIINGLFLSVVANFLPQISNIVSLIFLIPQITLLLRRLADLGRTWKSLLLMFVPFVNIYLTFIVLFSKGVE
jgi:uncharacterized membrane protein YhaH (DUF805 family)